MERTNPRRAGSSRPKPNMEMLRRRIELGLSRDDLGRLAGVSAKQIGLIERGVATHSREHTLAGIAGALNAKPQDIFDINLRLR